MATRRINRKNLPATPPPALVRQPNQSEQQTDILRLVLGAEEVSVNVPEGATLAEVEKPLTTLINGYKRIADAEERIKPVIGRMLVVARDRNLFRPEYKNITDYIVRRIEGDLGMSRNSAFEAIRIATAFPSLSVADYQRYGATRLLAATKITDEKDPQYQAILDDSVRQSAAQFREKVKQIRDSKAEPPTTFVVTLHLPNDWAESWKTLLESTNLGASELVMELIRSYVETHRNAPPQQVQPPVMQTH